MLLILFLTHKCSSPTGSCYTFGIDLLKWNDLKIIAQRSWYICSQASGHFCRLVIISAKGLVSDHDRHNIGHCHLSPVKDISSASLDGVAFNFVNACAGKEGI